MNSDTATEPETLGERIAREREAADRAMRLGLALSREDFLFILERITASRYAATDDCNLAATLSNELRERWLAPHEPEGDRRQH